MKCPECNWEIDRVTLIVEAETTYHVEVYEHGELKSEILEDVVDNYSFTFECDHCCCHLDNELFSYPGDLLP